VPSSWPVALLIRMPPGVLFSIRDPEASIPARLYRHGGTRAKLGPGERGIAQRFRRDVLEPWKHSGGTPRRPSVPEPARPYSYSTLPAARPRVSSRPHKPPPEITTKTPGAVLGPSPCWAAWLPHHLPHGAVLAMQDVCPAAGWLVFFHGALGPVSSTPPLHQLFFLFSKKRPRTAKMERYPRLRQPARGGDPWGTAFSRLVAPGRGNCEGQRQGGGEVARPPTSPGKMQLTFSDGAPLDSISGSGHAGPCDGLRVAARPCLRLGGHV
jgi:hypothetical protein